MADGKFLVSGLRESVCSNSFEEACGYLETALAEEVQTEAVKAGTMEKKRNGRLKTEYRKQVMMIQYSLEGNRPQRQPVFLFDPLLIKYYKNIIRKYNIF